MSLSAFSWAMRHDFKDPYYRLVAMAIGDITDPIDALCYTDMVRVADFACTTVEHATEVVHGLRSMGIITDPEFCPYGYDETFVNCYFVPELEAIRSAPVREPVYTKRPIPPRVRAAVYARDGDTCHYCGAELDAETKSLDHVIPESRGGEATTENLVVCCRSCNSSKGAKSYDEFLKWRAENV